jgi:hypothetical protein
MREHNTENEGDCWCEPSVIKEGDTNIYVHNPEVKTYIGTKIIKAHVLHENEWLRGKNQESAGRKGYKVMYPDGYISWSPKEQFEMAYREITSEEKKLVE